MDSGPIPVTSCDGGVLSLATDIGDGDDCRSLEAGCTTLSSTVSNGNLIGIVFPDLYSVLSRLQGVMPAGAFITR